MSKAEALLVDVGSTVPAYQQQFQQQSHLYVVLHVTLLTDLSFGLMHLLLQRPMAV
jgi:hypothetical protein